MTETDQQALKRSRAKLLTLIAIAFVPLFIAYAAYFYFPDWAPQGTTNQGELISPPLAGSDFSEALAAPGSWTLVLPLVRECDADCEQMLYLSRQIVIGLGKDTPRIKRALLAPATVSGPMAEWLVREHKDLQVISGDAPALQALGTEQPLLYLVDPNGNVILRYTLEKAGKPMMKDLKHLLRISNIG